MTERVVRLVVHSRLTFPETLLAPAEAIPPGMFSNPRPGSFLRHGYRIPDRQPSGYVEVP